MSRAVADRETGVVKWYNPGRGYGFITRSNGEDLFVHFSTVTGEDPLKQGQKVEYDMDDSGPGPTARDVKPL